MEANQRVSVKRGRAEAEGVGHSAKRLECARIPPLSFVFWYWWLSPLPNQERRNMRSRTTQGTDTSVSALQTLREDRLRSGFLLQQKFYGGGEGGGEVIEELATLAFGKAQGAGGGINKAAHGLMAIAQQTLAQG